MDDFNDTPKNKSIGQYALGTSNLKKVINDGNNSRLYNLMTNLVSRGQGTYYYRKKFLMLDQFLVSRGFLIQNPILSIKPHSASIENLQEIKNKNASPKRFGRPNNKTLNPNGYSDHFPISLVIID